MTHKFHINMADEPADALKELAERQDLSITEVIRRSVKLYEYVTKRESEGKHLWIEDGDNMYQVIML